jgi:hypothetical protein
MKERVQFFGGVFVLMFALSFVIFGSASAEEMKHMHHGRSANMEMHHMHIMMDHGLEMVTEGSNLVMLADMKMAPSLDQMTLDHGRHMIADGKDLIEHMMSGHEMKSMHKAGHGDNPLMKYTHELGAAMREYVDIVADMGMKDDMSGDMMTMHHMHMLINHAVNMAAEGSSLVMLGQMGMAKDLDKGSVEHGKMMISDADKLLKEVMEGSAMKEMHEKGIKMDNDMMAYTHKLGAAATKVVDLLSDMPK